MVRSGPAQSSEIKGHLSLTPKQGKEGHKYNLEYVHCVEIFFCVFNSIFAKYLQCMFHGGHGWVRGGYTCRCKPGFFSPTAKNEFNGSLVEVTFD